MPIRVAHIVTRLDVGGAQETVLRICAGLERSEFDPYILAGIDVGSGGSLKTSAQAAGIPVIDITSLRGPVRPAHDLSAVGELTSTLRKLRPQIVHTHSSKAGAVGRVAARIAGIPHVIHTVHGWSFNDDQPRLVAATYRQLERTLARMTDALVVVTDVDRIIGLRHRIGWSGQYALVRSGISISPPMIDRDQIRSSLGWGHDDRVVIAVGRLEPQKDPLALMNAFAIASQSIPEARLVYVGDGSLAPLLTARAIRLGLQARVDLLGIRSDVPNLLHAADVFASAARWEGLPRTVLEAAAAGTPAAVTDVGGTREVVEDRISGRLVPASDPRRLADAITSLLAAPDIAAAMAREARARVEPFSDAKMVADTESLYCRVAAARRC